MKSRALFRGVDLSNNTEISLCALGPVSPDVALEKKRERANDSIAGRNDFVLHS